MDYINWDEPSMKLALHGVPGILHRSLAFVLDDAILEVRRINKLAKEGNADISTDYYRAAKIKLVEEKLMELLSFVLDWDKEKLDD